MTQTAVLRQAWKRKPDTNMLHVVFIFVSCAIFFTSIDCTSTCCRDGWLPYHGSCYMFYDQTKVAWNDALVHCKNHNSNLVIIESEWENLFLKAYARKIFNSGNLYRNITAFWIGASDLDIEGIWKWVETDEELTYMDHNFLQNVDNSPDNREDCVALNGAYNFNWSDGVCIVRIGYPICEMRPVSNSGGGVAMIG